MFTLFPWHRVESYYHHYTLSSFLILSHTVVTTAIEKRIRMLLHPAFSTYFFNNYCRRNICFEALVVAVVSSKLNVYFLDNGPCYAVTLGSTGLGSKASKNSGRRFRFFSIFLFLWIIRLSRIEGYLKSPK